MKFSNKLRDFQEILIPEGATSLVGYSALINQYQLQLPIPLRLSAIGHQHKKFTSERWIFFTSSYKPEETLVGHLTFALKYEGVDLAVLNSLFKKNVTKELEIWIKSEPVGQYSRRIWFLYEWLTGVKLQIADAKKSNFVNVIDEKQQFVGPAEVSKRHRVRNNLPGMREFCPLIRKTDKLKKYIDLQLDKMANEKTKAVHKDIINRAASFLLLQDSRASFEIEKERPTRNRVERWGRVISEAGLHPLSIDELERLQKILIEDNRFVFLGLRGEGGFIGMHDRRTQLPIPDHISARPYDLLSLMEGLIETNQRSNKEKKLHAVLLAAMISFGFVYIHPFADGNGRLHRYLIHHVLAEQGFSPKHFIFPVSAVLLDRIDEYKQVLESFSKPRLKFIEWQPTDNGNIEVLNDTGDLYRYFDATREAEFLFDCVLQTIEETLPEEIDYLQKYDRMKGAITERFDIPDYLVDLLINFLRQNNGKLSKRARRKEFAAFSEQESEKLETLFSEIFFEK